MPKKKRGQSKIEELNGDHFTFQKTAVHGFPSSPSAISYIEDLNFLILGTANGEIAVYGRPGVEYHEELSPKAPILKIFPVTKMHQFLTVAGDNSIASWSILCDEEDGRFYLSQQKRYHLSDSGKTITSCCLSSLRGYLFLGVEGGNVYRLDLKSFELADSMIFWNNATALAQPAAQTHPGAVKSLEISPADPNKLLIGYELGIIALWDLENNLPTRNYPGAVSEGLKSVEALAWHRHGRKFMSSHSDGTIMSWTQDNNSKNDSLAVNRYGDNCRPITKLTWLDSESDPMVIFSGGVPSVDDQDHHTVSIHHGANAIALDFTSKIVDFLTITAPASNKGEVLVVLAQEEIMAFDLTNPKILPIRQPYLHPIHSCNITTMKVYQNCSSHLFDKLEQVAKDQETKYSDMEWPIMGGYVKDAPPKTYDVIITGHENGAVRFWNITTMGQNFMFEVPTANLFKLDGDHPTLLTRESVDKEQEGEEFEWPPYKKVGSYDPLGDDPRLSVTSIEFCLSSRSLCVGGVGGQVILFALASTSNEVTVEAVQAVVIPKGDNRYPRIGEEAMTCVNKLVEFPRGFQPRFLMQLYPPAPIGAMDFKANWGVVAVGTSHGFAVGNYLLNSVVITHCTLAEDGSAFHQLGRMQSVRRSLRNSFRRSRSGRQSGRDRQNQSKGRKGGANKKAGPDQPAQKEVATPNMQAAISHMLLSETFLSGPDPTPSLVASTIGSVLIRYYLQLPSTGDRISEPSVAMLAGKDYSLLHGAPVVSLFILDNAGIPLPTAYEQDNLISPAPVMTSPHYAVIVTEEQIKVILLPSLKAKRKEKVTDEIHQRIRKAFFIRVKVLAPSDSPRDWHPALMIFTDYGTVLIYSLPTLKLCCIVKNFVDPGDIRAQRTLVVSNNGEVFYLKSFSEIQRCVMCAYNGSYHVSQKPSLFPFEGSTQPLPARQRVLDLPEETTEPVPTPPAGHTEESVKVEVHQQKDTELPKNDKSNGGQILKEAEEYLKKTQQEKPLEEHAKETTKQFIRSHNDSISSSSSSSSSSSDSDEDINTGEQMVMSNPLAMGFEDGEQSGQQLDSIIESSLQELNNARKFYQEMQAKAKKT